MKLCCLFPLIVAASALGASDPTATVPAERPRLTDEMRRRVEGPAQVDTISAKPAGSAVELPPVQVGGSYQPGPLTPEQENPAGRPFTWKDGGTIFKRDDSRLTTELEFRYNPDWNAVEMLKISW
jgi:hypothetical protein